MNCRICNSAIIKEKITAREMLNGTRLPFIYFTCAECLTVQIESTDLDMTKYYNEKYYSLSDKIQKKNRLTYLRNAAAILGKVNLIGNILELIFPIYKEYKLCANLININSRILDIGCGNGEFLKILDSLGFKDLTGIEPYLTKTIEYNSNFKIQRTEIDSLDDSFDLIRLHHVFEHVSDPIKTLQSVYKNLSSSGTVVLTIPIADYVYNTYKENSYILQAPHHFHLFTLNGITRLTQSSGFKIQRVVRNARGISNWIYISELWNNNITTDESIHLPIPPITLIQKISFWWQERKLIWNKQGDNVTLILTK